jgi:hypothetical protein
MACVVGRRELDSRLEVNDEEDVLVKKLSSLEGDRWGG